MRTGVRHDGDKCGRYDGASDDCLRDPIVALLSDIRGTFGTARAIVVGGDINAKHESWGGSVTDVREDVVSDWMVVNRLELLNDAESEPPVSTVNGSSWIDLSMCRGVECLSWEVADEETLSDHRLLVFELRAPRVAGTLRRVGYRLFPSDDRGADSAAHAVKRLAGESELAAIRSQGASWETPAVTESELLGTVRSINLSKAPGPDGVPPKVLR